MKNSKKFKTLTDVNFSSKKTVTNDVYIIIESKLDYNWADNTFEYKNSRS